MGGLLLAVLADLDSARGCMHVRVRASEKMNTFMNSRHENLEAIIKRYTNVLPVN